MQHEKPLAVFTKKQKPFSKNHTFFSTEIAADRWRASPVIDSLHYKVLNVRVIEIKHLSLEISSLKHNDPSAQVLKHLAASAMLKCWPSTAEEHSCARRDSSSSWQWFDLQIKKAEAQQYSLIWLFNKVFLGEKEKKQPWLSASRSKLLTRGLCQLLYLQIACSGAFEKTPLSLTEMPQHMQKNKQERYISLLQKLHFAR